MKILPRFASANYLVFGFVAAVVLCCAVSVNAGSMSHDSVKAGDLLIINAHSTATPPGAKVGAGYLKIENHGSEDDVLLSATVDFAQVTEFHTMEMQDDVMKMRKLAEPVVIEADGEFIFSSGADHLMFMKLTSPLIEGESVTVNLVFEKTGSVEVTMKVLKPGMAEDMGHGKMKHGDMPTEKNQAEKN